MIWINCNVKSPTNQWIYDQWYTLPVSPNGWSNVMHGHPVQINNNGTAMYTTWATETPNTLGVSVYNGHFQKPIWIIAGLTPWA